MSFGTHVDIFHAAQASGTPNLEYSQLMAIYIRISTVFLSGYTTGKVKSQNLLREV